MIVRSIDGVVEVLAPAKLNLFLEILARRPDGYHEIESLMVAVDLHDTLFFADDPSGTVSLRCDDPSLPVGGENLVIKAAERLRSATGCHRGARIELRKSIPAQAGLAGGSSDAAATLVGLDRLWNLGTPHGQLSELAGEIGSDVAFFLGPGRAAICRGRGELVEEIALPRAIHFVLICPPVGVSTAEVYQHVRPPDGPRSIDPVLDALSHDDLPSLGERLFNRLQEIAEGIRPELVRVRNALAGVTPPLLGSLMSGSGSAYFGLCRDRASAENAARNMDPLELGWVRAVTCGPLEQAENAS
jgi:4-diphosphocytidyl-2-C-methyl-D-erythritol kinase